MDQKSKTYLSESVTGSGVFARDRIIKGKKIIDFHGSIIKFEELPTPYKDVEDHYVQIGRYLYMGPSGGTDDFINHSCDPNSGLVINGEKVSLIAIRDIEIGEEIVLDYSTTMNEDDWEMNCDCESPNCRGKIRDFKYLPKQLQKKYARLDIVPDYNLNSTSTK